MQREEQGGRWLSKRADEMLGNKEGWEVEGGKRGSCVVSLYVKRLAELQSPLSEQVLTTWQPPPPPYSLCIYLFLSLSPCPHPFPSLCSLLFFFLFQWWASHCSSGPLLLFTAGIIISVTHTVQTHCKNSYHAALTGHPLNTHTHKL